MRITLVVFMVASLMGSGCVSVSLKRLRDRIPVGYAGEVEGSVVIVAGGGAGFKGSNVEKPSKNVITADAWSEYVITPWGKSELVLKDAGIGKKRTVVAPVEPSEVK